jgi:glycogen(starch) synthase
MRVLTVGNMYPPHHFGGYELVWRSAVEHLRSRGHEVEVLTTDTDTGATEPDPPGVHRELRWRIRDAQFQEIGRRAKVELARQNHRMLERRLEELRPDVLGWWSMGGLSLTMLETVRRRGIPAVGFVHDDWLDYGPRVDGWLHMFRGDRARLAPLAERLAGIPARVDFDGAATYMFGSHRTRRHAAARGVELSRTGVAELGIHTDYLDPAPPQEWGWRLVYVGRLDPRKGVDTAVEALPHLPAEARLELIGGWDSQEEDRLRGIARDLGVAERVTFSGHRDRLEIADAYARADAAIFPVRWEEPWGLVPLEAMGKGRPVVATGRGGSAEYLRDGENCLLFEAGDPEALAAALHRLAGDAGLRERLREGGLETAPRFTEPLYNEAVERALLDAVGTSRTLVEA